MRTTPAQIGARKGGEPIVCLTAYTAPIASVLDAHVDVLLVGDSVATVFYGLPSTRGISLDTMTLHAAAVVRGSTNACVVVDLPWGTYETSPEQALESARRLLEESGAQAVKLEGGVDRADVIRRLTDAGIPVMGHVGLLPQRADDQGGYRVLGRDPESRKAVLADAHATVDAGAFALVVESTVEPLAREITAAIPIPTIGIGASPACDGQVLVVDDMLGLFKGFTPKFVKRYADVAGAIDEAAEAFAADVRARRFPSLEHCYGATLSSPDGDE